MNEIDILSLAQQLKSLNLSLVPVENKTKRPAIEWKEYQSRQATEDELKQWFANGQTGFGVVCGKVSSNLVCLDFDDLDAFEFFVIRNNLQLGDQVPNPNKPALWLPVAASSRGRHVLFRTASATASRDLYLEDYAAKAGDLIADGKFVVLPPTFHPNGKRREWVNPITTEIPELQLSTLGIIKRQADPVTSFEEGSRHTTMVTIASRLANVYTGYAELLAALLDINRSRFAPPLPLSEVESIAHYMSSNLANHDHLPKRIVSDDIGMNLSDVITTTMSKGNDHDFDQVFLTATEYLQERIEEPIEWLIEDMLPLSYLTVLGATSKAGKSCLVSNLVNAVCAGRPFLGMKTHQSSVLWLAYEESESERAMILRQYLPIPDNLYITHDKVLLDDPKGIRCLRHWIQKTGAKLLVVDPLYGAVKADSLADGRKARVALEGLKELCRTEKVTAIVLHHFTKNVSAGSTRERFADSNQILATASMDWTMETFKNLDDSRDIRLVGTGRGEFANRTWVIHSTSPVDFELCAVGSAEDIRQSTLLSDIQTILAQAPKGMTAAEIADALRVHPGTLRNRITGLVREQKITVIGNVGKAKVYGANQELLPA